MMTEQTNQCPTCGRSLPDGETQCAPQWHDSHYMDDKGTFKDAWADSQAYDEE